MLCVDGPATDPAASATLRYFAEQVKTFSTQRIGLTSANRRVVPLTRDYQYAAAQFAGHHARGDGIREVAQAASAAPPPSASPPALDLLLDGLVTRFTQGYAAGVPVLQRAVDAFCSESISDEEELRWLRLAGRFDPEEGTVGRVLGRGLRRLLTWGRAGTAGRPRPVSSPLPSCFSPLGSSSTGWGCAARTRLPPNSRRTVRRKPRPRPRRRCWSPARSRRHRR